MRTRPDVRNDPPSERATGTGRARSAAAADPPVPAAVLELRSALTSILASSEILRDYPDMPDAQRVRFLEAVIAEGKRLDRMISRMVERSELDGSAETDPV